MQFDTWIVLCAVVASTGLSISLHLRNGRYLRENRNESRKQTRLLDQLYQLQDRALRPGIEERLRQRIVTALLQSGYYDSRDARDVLIARLPRAFGTSLTRNNIPRLDLQTLVERAARWDAGTLREVLTCALEDLNGGYAGREVGRILADLDAAQAGRAALADDDAAADLAH